MNKPPSDQNIEGPGESDSARRGRTLPGINYKQGAIDYPHKLDASNRYHLFTKPFYNLANKIDRWSSDGLDEDTYRHFCDFANIAYTLDLPPGSRILDVGCGPGWLCEYFARFGYQMTGVDISSELVRVANERLDKLAFDVDYQTKLRCRFLVHDIETAPLAETFDAVICYDALHHFEDEHAVLKNIGAMLETGGQFFVAEGERPAEDSENEAELMRVMEQYQTLESPFSRDYLLDLLPRYGFSVVGDYATVQGFVDRDSIDGDGVRFVETPAFNYFLCKKVGTAPVFNSKEPSALRAEFSLQTEAPKQVAAGSKMEVVVEVKNTGDTLWLVSSAPLKGRVRVGLKVLDENDRTVTEIHGWPRLRKAIGPGEKTILNISCQAPHEPGNYTLKVDLVNQEICWFEQHGSEPLVLPFAVVR